MSESHVDDNITFRARILGLLESDERDLPVTKMMRTCDNHESVDTRSLPETDYFVSVGHFGRYMGDIADRATGTFDFFIEGARGRRVRVVNGQLNMLHLAIDLFNVRDATNIVSYPPGVAECINYVWMVVSTELSPASINQIVSLIDTLCTTRNCRCEHLSTGFNHDCDECNFRLV